MMFCLEQDDLYVKEPGTPEACALLETKQGGASSQTTWKSVLGHPFLLSEEEFLFLDLQGSYFHILYNMVWVGLVLIPYLIRRFL